MNHIRIKGARQNNLKNIDLQIPLNRITVITGMSGAGKSSLAFDTLYAEGQRRYVETFSPYARQFMDRMDRPQVDAIDGIPPAIAIDRKYPVRTSRSTVGTMTEITDYVKLLFSNKGQLHCRECGQPVIRQTPAGIWEQLAQFPPESRAVFTFPFSEKDPQHMRRSLEQLGYDRYLHETKIHDLSQWGTGMHPLPLNMVADRLHIRREERTRAIDSIEQALALGNGRMDIWLDQGRHMGFSNRLECPRCAIEYPAPSNNLFSFNSPIGACPACRGFGRVIDVDPDLVIPDRRLSIEQGAIKPWGSADEAKIEFLELMEFCQAQSIPTNIPFQDLDAKHQSAIINGREGYYGIRGFFKWLESKTYKMHVRVYLSRYRSYNSCPDCHGARFKPEALLYRIEERTIAQIYEMNVDRALHFFQTLPLSESEAPARLLVEEILSRLQYLQDVGLGYLTLDRQSRTLSGGEVQRAALASALGARLVNTLYVLDEPSIGLHPRDVQRLIGILKRLKNQGNTLAIVEHDPQIIQSSDFLLDLGPGAGAAGGQIMYFGPTGEVKNSPTAAYLSGQETIPHDRGRILSPPENWLTIKGASANNLKSIDVHIPLQRMVCLTGVSGSGKSTLALDVLYRGCKRRMGDFSETAPGPHADILGLESISNVVMVDQQPIGRTPRGNIATYVKAMDKIRSLLAATPQARRQKMGPGYFSFNVAGGRCEACRGDGFEKIEMQFLSDVYVACPDCGGARFKPQVLEIRYEEKNIHEILSMTVAEAMIFFECSNSIAAALEPLIQVGLGYLALGQPINTLSGGEAQRLKLSAYLRQTRSDHQLFIFDEPTTGLHFQDVDKLLIALRRLTAQGHSVLVIEHHLDMIRAADWIIDLGPEGGDSGGQVVAQGPPDVVAEHRDSHTGRFLKAPECRFEPEQPGKTQPDSIQAEALRFIEVKGARQHNLQQLSIRIPHNQLVALAGVSGSGKSTLAFDVIFAEGQRRYLESLAPYVRQYVKILERPEVDVVNGLSPTVAIEQRVSQFSRRSTVATMTEIYHFLRLLFSKLGTRHCPQCSRVMETRSADEICRDIELLNHQNARILAPKVYARKGFHRDIFSEALAKGFSEARIDGHIIALPPETDLNRYQEHTIEIVIGKLPAKDPKALVRLALAEGNGSMIAVDSSGGVLFYSTQAMCPVCGIGTVSPDPRLFSFNSRYGACGHCTGLGEIDGATCSKCHGSRLNATALAVRVQGKTLWDLVQLPANDLYSELGAMNFDERQNAVARPVLSEILGRLSLLNRLGLSYLNLSRSADTLSGGEAQRVRLATQLGSNLTGVCYIIDEPTIGLHPRDTRMLLDALLELRDRGNTILAVEHDESTIRAADHVIELGPGAGKSGGRVIFQGPPKGLETAPDSPTGAFLKPSTRLRTSRLRPYQNAEKLTVIGASAHNLKNIDVEFPLHTLLAVAGVSGSGKSSLLKSTLYQGLKARLAGEKPSHETCRDILNCNALDRVLEVDHSPIGHTSRSVPASYVGFLSSIRDLFAATPVARARAYAPGRFSFNLSEGQCPACKGQGHPKISMSFLPDVYALCEVCHGRRFNPDTLSVTYKGRSISDILDLTFAEARDFFAAIPEIRKALEFVCDTGLGYLQLGQPSPTLSGGEAQRIKLARNLIRPGRGHTLFILDEPTTGLHPADVKRLIDVLQKLVDQGHTVAVIEHNLQLLQAADYIIDLGPEGGNQGGRITAAGSPVELVAHADRSHTARCLKDWLQTLP